jgi:DNA adenine methylase
VKPPFTYFGGKTAIAERIAALLPPHEHYVEPFAGSLAVLLAKRRSRMETVNDLDGDLMNFWRVLRDDPEGLERACFLTPHSRGEHIEAHDRENVTDLERARRVWVRLTQGRGGHTTRRTGWRFYQDPRGTHSSMPEYIASYARRLAPAAARLAGVTLECKPALDLIREYGRHPDTLLYVDPPYLGSVRTWGNNYAHEMRTEAEHEALAGVLTGIPSTVVLSGYRSALYDELYTGWHEHLISTQTGNGKGDRSRTEVVWSNRPFPQGHLFDAEGAAS